MIATRARRTFSTGVAAAAVLVGVLVAPAPAVAAAAVPSGLSPDDPGSYPTSSAQGVQRRNVELTWSDTGASTYRVQLTGANGDFTTPAVDETVTIPRFAVPSALPHGDWGWRVRSDDGAWSGTAWFTRGWADAPADPQLVSGTTSPGGPTLTWGALPDASYYEVQLSPVPFDGADDAGSTIGDQDVQACFTQNTTFTPYKVRKGDDVPVDADASTRCEELGGGPFYWRVRGRDGVFDPRETHGPAPVERCTGHWRLGDPVTSVQTSGCSEWALPAEPAFVVDQTTGLGVLPAPTGLDLHPRAADTPDPVEVTNAPVFTWDPVPGASFYRVYQSRTRDHGDANHVWETTGTALSPVTDDPGWRNRLYWSVQTCTVAAPEDEDEPVFVLDQDSEDVLCGEPSAPRSYRRAALDVVQPVSTVVDGPATVLTWTTLLDGTKPAGSLQNRTNEAAGYLVEVSGPDGDFSSPSLSVRTDGLGTAPGERSWAVPTASLPLAWTWRVRAFDQTGHEYPWSSSPAKAAAAAVRTTVSTGSSDVAKGDDVVWTVTVENVGTAPAADVTVDVPLATGLSLTSSASAGAYADGTWTVGTLAAGATATLTLTTKVTGLGAITQQACATTPTPELDAGDNCASDRVSATAPDLTVTAQVDAAGAAVGDVVAVVVGVRNVGTATAPGVKVTDLVPAALEVKTSSESGVSGSTWTVGTLAVGAEKQVALTAKVVGPGAVAVNPCASTTAVEVSTTNNCASTAFAVPTPASPVASLVTGNGFGQTARLRVRFSAPVTGVGATTLRLTTPGGAVVPGTSVRALSSQVYELSRSSGWVAGERYRLAVDGAVRATGTGAAVTVDRTWVRATTVVDSASSSLQVGRGDRGWTTVRSARAHGKSYLSTVPVARTRNPAWVQTTVRGSKVAVRACRTPSSGKVRLKVDGRTVLKKSLYRKRGSRCGVVARITVDPGSAHTVRLQAMGRKVKRSKGYAVSVDAFTVS